MCSKTRHNRKIIEWKFTGRIIQKTCHLRLRLDFITQSTGCQVVFCELDRCSYTEWPNSGAFECFELLSATVVVLGVFSELYLLILRRKTIGHVSNHFHHAVQWNEPGSLVSLLNSLHRFVFFFLFVTSEHAGEFCA